ncbi:bactericidal permeability-increasing protein-like isoform X1 [Montipora capricornis]|uniref:bactericidal permeability-increasing protein-like isoform X1 n=1 Tax=Montipora capricornis TaxID=246305 RepID=UPI0035F1278B
MAELQLTRNLLLIFFFVIRHTMQESTGKSVTMNFDLVPEWKTEISQRASDYVEHIILPFMAKELDELTVPTVKGKIKTPLGEVQYELKNVKLSNVVLEKFKVSLLPDNALQIHANHASGNVASDWHYKESSWPHISDSGSCDLSITDLSLEMSFFVDGDLEKENTKVSAKDCNIKIGSLHVQFKGGASWLYNMFADGLASHLKDKLTKQICDAAIDLINSKANEKLNTFPSLMKKFAAGFGH